MKIGIITMPLCSNYGGILQNWALQQVLVKLGHEPITLRFPVGYQGMSSAHFWFKIFPIQLMRFVAHKFIDGKCSVPMTIKAWKESVSGMERFVDNNINVTECLPNLSMKDVTRYGISALVVGSDQIWRPVRYDAAKYYFLGFTEGSDLLRIAYAPSVALDEWPYDEKTTVKLRELIINFSAVSVREESSVKLIKDNLHIDATWVLDPTMLLKKEDYSFLCDNIPKSTKPFVFAYILDLTNEKKMMAETTAMMLGCRVEYKTAGTVISEDTIEKWLANFRDAKYVITDSYHGTIFSLLFHKEFYCFYNEHRGVARMDSLKKISGLSDRFIQSPVELSENNIDYTSVDKSIDRKREMSLSYLRDALRRNK